MIMRQLADVVSKYDVYIAPYMQPRPPRDENAPPPPPPPPGPIRDHFSVANLCGYPALSVPNGFDEKGRPTGITFLGRLYAEAEVLAVAKPIRTWHGGTNASPHFWRDPSARVAASRSARNIATTCRISASRSISGPSIGRARPT